MDNRKLVIILTHVRPPIPFRGNDWSAHVDGDEETGRYGWGIGAAEALHDLIDTLDGEDLLP